MEIVTLILLLESTSVKNLSDSRSDSRSDNRSNSRSDSRADIRATAGVTAAAAEQQQSNSGLIAERH